MLQLDLSDLWAVIAGVWRLDPAVFGQPVPDGQRLTLALLVLAAASLSTTLGQSGTLFANRVTRFRFGLGLLAGGLALAVAALVWSGTIWLAGWLLGPVAVPFLAILADVSLSTAPLLFGFLIFLPYLGTPLSRLLRLWTLLAVVLAVQLRFGVPVWWASGYALLGWGLWEVANLWFERWLNPLRDRLWLLVTGTPTMTPLDDLAAQLEQTRAALRRASPEEGQMPKP
ncbi:MAG: hypothetical protein MUD01_03265 [Chloroflexaceae bacterium]|jgi:hypothetical protein|nr:hypothetical protein [Chloroflexaceae bacterium]